MSADQASTIHLFDPDSKGKFIIFFITGNPGLIEYYRTFLSHLYALLSRSSQGPVFQVFGRSLSGFEVLDDGVELKEMVAETQGKVLPPYSLQAQIEGLERTLEGLVKRETQRCGDNVKVILMGHSVGAFILLEILRRHREKLNSTNYALEAETFTIEGGVCLFPTVTHIMRSHNGRKFGFFLCLPQFALIASVLVKLMTFCIPSSIVCFIIQKAMSFPSDAARTTTAFIKSKWGVRQALHMASDEMVTITTDSWDEEIWGVAHSSLSPPRRSVVRFLFGKKDHWVADETRDELIKTKAWSEQEDWKPKMEVDEVEGWPHGFCINHSVPVAEKVKSYIEEIIRSDGKRYQENCRRRASR